MRKSENRVRITGQLIDASTGGNLWADRFEGALEGIFDLQDQITTSVVGAIAPQLEYGEIARAKRKPTGSLDAYDYFLRGILRNTIRPFMQEKAVVEKFMTAGSQVSYLDGPEFARFLEGDTDRLVKLVRKIGLS